MFKKPLTPEEIRALRRVKAGLAIDPSMLWHLSYNGLVQRRLGTNRLSADGERLLHEQRDSGSLTGRNGSKADTSGELQFTYRRGF